MQALLLLACIENGIGSATDASEGWGPDMSNYDGPPVNLSFDIALQRNHWGEGMGRCQIQLAFVEAGADGWGAPQGPPLVVQYPETAGECLYSDLDTSVEGQKPEGGGPAEGEEAPENWNLAGVFEGHDVIWLHSGYRSIALERVELEGDLGVRYQWEGCNDEDFPFGEVFDLEVPPSDDPDAIPPFYVEEAFGIGPDLELLSPRDEPGSGGLLYLEVGEDLDAEWAHRGDSPLVRGLPLERRVDVVYRNFDEARTAIEAIACLPAADSFRTEGEILEELSANEHADDEDYSLGFQVDAIYESPPFESPWGQSVRVRTTVTEGGNVVLYRTE